jgi:hypothetical protein
MVQTLFELHYGQRLKITKGTNLKRMKGRAVHSFVLRRFKLISQILPTNM